MKLTHSIREAILKDLLEHRFRGDEVSLRNEQKVISYQAYDIVLNETLAPKDRNLLRELPAIFFKPFNKATFYFPGEEYFQAEYENAVRFPAGLGTTFIIDEKHNDIIKRYWEYAQNKKALRKAKDEARTQAKPILYRATTDTKLIELWPEIAPFVKRAIPKERFLPEIRVQALNETFNLVSEKENKQVAFYASLEPPIL